MEFKGYLLGGRKTYDKNENAWYTFFLQDATDQSQYGYFGPRIIITKSMSSSYLEGTGKEGGSARINVPLSDIQQYCRCKVTGYIGYDTQRREYYISRLVIDTNGQ